jgi:hypothetical protein
MNVELRQRARPRRWRTGEGGSSLIEVIVALLLLQVGLLATAGMVLSAQRVLSRARTLQRGVLEAVRSADSLREWGWTTGGERVFPWGRVEWLPESEWAEGIRIFSLGPQNADTLFRLRAWSMVEPGFMNPGNSTPRSGGGG